VLAEAIAGCLHAWSCKLCLLCIVGVGLALGQ
jgi:hypothetical protein